MEELDTTVADLARNKVDKAPYHQKIEFVEG